MKFITGLILLLVTIEGYSQSLANSESVVKYDMGSHTTDKPIPFNRPFTLVIEKASFKDVTNIYAYQTEYTNGILKKTFDIMVRTEKGGMVPIPIVDIILNYKPYDGNLYIYFPPLKPNETFDIHIITQLTKACFDMLKDINTDLAILGDKPDADYGKIGEKYDNFLTCTDDISSGKSYVSADFLAYKEYFFKNPVDPLYQILVNEANFSIDGKLSPEEVQVLEKTSMVKEFSNGYVLNEISSGNNVKKLMLGLINVSNVFLYDVNDARVVYSPEKRLANLKENQEYINTVLNVISTSISKGAVDPVIGGVTYSLIGIKMEMQKIYNSIGGNIKVLTKLDKQINIKLQNNKSLRQGEYLAGNTVASDLKSAGGRVLFMDAGIANILAPDLNNKLTYIPKLFLGASIYFRPIDKNTRMARFSSKFSPELSLGKNSNPDYSGGLEYGPDYNIASEPSIWHRLSLNLGVTFGGMTNPQFDNFFSSNSLLTGLSYRFARAYKVGGGVSLLRRSSKNPLISEKQIIVGPYLSLSVDIDFIQSIKDVTSLILK